MEQSTVNERIKALVEHYASGNKSAFARAVGISNQSLAEILGARQSAPSFPALQKILTALPQLSSDWLVLGMEPMHRESVPQVNNIAEQLSQLTLQYMDITKQLEDKRAAYREALNSLEIIKEDIDENKGLIEIHREALPNMNVESQKIFLPIMEEQKGKLVEAQMRYKAYLPFYTRAESEMINMSNAQLSIGVEINNLISQSLNK